MQLCLAGCYRQAAASDGGARPVGLDSVQTGRVKSRPHSGGKQDSLWSLWELLEDWADGCPYQHGKRPLYTHKSREDNINRFTTMSYKYIKYYHIKISNIEVAEPRLSETEPGLLSRGLYRHQDCNKTWSKAPVLTRTELKPSKDQDLK